MTLQRPEQYGVEPQLEEAGVIEASVEQDGKTLHIAFDPSRMTDEKAALLAHQLQTPSEPRFRRSPLRLKRHACEAAGIDWLKRQKGSKVSATPPPASIRD